MLDLAPRMRRVRRVYCGLALSKSDFGMIFRSRARSERFPYWPLPGSRLIREQRP